MKVVSFYTDNGSYKAEAELFTASLDRVGMRYHIEEVEDGGDWYENTRQKPQFIQRMLRESSEPILYLDVDAFVHKNCEEYFDKLADNGTDFGAHWFQGPSKGWDKKKVQKDGWWMLSGTLFFNNTEQANRLVDTWCLLNDTLYRQGIAEGGGQKNLWFLNTCINGVVVARIPGRYCFVFDKPWAYPKAEPCIIEHTIASRDHRDGDYRETIPRAKRIKELWKSLDEGRDAESVRLEKSVKVATRPKQRPVPIDRTFRRGR